MVHMKRRTAFYAASEIKVDNEIVPVQNPQPSHHSANHVFHDEVVETAHTF